MYKIEYINDIYDNVNDFIDDLYEKIDDNNVYNMLRDKILNSKQSKDIGSTNPNRNSLLYVTKFHRELTFENIMTSLECEVAASFASQSNHNIIGRTNEIFQPIKYYKINDDDDKFWIEFYDRCNLKIPLSFNDKVTFTMDMVFLQNRKLLYS